MADPIRHQSGGPVTLSLVKESLAAALPTESKTPAITRAFKLSPTGNQLRPQSGFSVQALLIDRFNLARP